MHKVIEIKETQAKQKEQKSKPQTMKNIQAFFDAFAIAAEKEDAKRFFSLQYDEFESIEQVKEWFKGTELIYKATLLEIIEETDLEIKVKAKVSVHETEDGRGPEENVETLQLIKPGAPNYGKDNEFGIKLFLR